MGVLRSISDERFCQLVVSGRDPADAYRDTDGKAKNAGLAAARRMAKERIGNRIQELLEQSGRRAMLSRAQILERVFDDWETSRRLGQMASALTAGKMIGSELYSMFTDKKEIGGAGDFDKKTPQELMEYIQSGLGEMGMEAKTITKHLGLDVDDDGNLVIPPKGAE